MNLAACYCTFQREKDGPWEDGIAITSEHGMSSVVVMYPAEAVGSADEVGEVWNYRLDWTASLYPRGQ